MPKPPLTPPAIPIALQNNHLLSPPPDRLTNTPTTLSITQERQRQKQNITVHLQAHEPNSPPKPLFTISEKQWPGTRTISAQDIPHLTVRRAWLSGTRRWITELPKHRHTDRSRRVVLEASMPWERKPMRAGRGFRLDVWFRNALTPAQGIGTYVEPPSYSDVFGTEERNDHFPGTDLDLDLDTDSGGDGQVGLHGLPSYSVRLGCSTLRDLLDAIEPPAEPAPAPDLRVPLGVVSRESGAEAGSTVELKVVRVASGTAVMLGRQTIMHIARLNAMDYSRSRARLKPKWEVEVAGGVDLLLAVNIVLIMMEFG